jgi:hypothetical protein
MDTRDILQILRVESTFTFIRNENEEILGYVTKIHVDSDGQGGSVEFMDVMEGIERSLGFFEISDIKT